MRRSRFPWALIAVACAIGLMATDARAQLFRRSSPKPAPAAADPPAASDEDATTDTTVPRSATRGASQLLRNGIDYLETYGDPKRALPYLKEAKRRQKELLPAEQKSLDAALARAQRMIAGTEAAKTPVVRRSTASPLTRGAGGSLFDEPVGRTAQRRGVSSPMKADAAIQTTAASAAAEPRPLVLQGLATPAAIPSAAQEPPAGVSPSNPGSPSAVAEPESSDPAQPIGLTILPGPEDPAGAAAPSEPAISNPAEPASESATPLEPSDPAPGDAPPAASAGSDAGSEPQPSDLTPPAADASETAAPPAAPAVATEVGPALDVPSLPDTSQPPAQEALDVPSLPVTSPPPAEDTSELPELHASPIEGSGATRTDDSIPAIMPSRARVEDRPPGSGKLLLPPPAPRPVQRVEGMKVVDPAPHADQPANLEPESIPAQALEPAAQPATLLAPPELPSEPPALSGADTRARVEPEIPAISRTEPVRSRPNSTPEPAAVSAAPAPPAEELLVAPSTPAAPTTESLPTLPEPPPALPQPRAVAAAADSGEELPPLPVATGDDGAAAGAGRARAVLPDPIASEALGDIKLRRPETMREIEELARRQSREARETTDSGMSGTTPPRRDDTTADLPRAPAPTEARPIKPIEIPEEFIPLEQRNFSPQRKFWAAPALCHTPLYFQDAVLERYGQNVEQAIGPAGRYFSYPLDDPRQSIQRQQLLQPAYSAGMFFLQLAAWPYNLVMDPPWEAHYDLGYYRPGDPIPPDTTYLPTTGLGPPLRGRKY